MPYIPEERRSLLRPELRGLIRLIEIDMNLNKGDMNYMITQIVMAWLRSMGMSYETISQVPSLLEDIAYEFRRRVMDPYEDAKRMKNGDVF